MAADALYDHAVQRQASQPFAGQLVWGADERAATAAAMASPSAKRLSTCTEAPSTR
jgi:hypothetical protein